MYRKIGEVAELLGITTSAIRKYEEKGILKSKRQEGNEYRQYDVHDIAKFIRARMYKGMGFSLSEAVDILNNTRISEYPEVIERQKVKVAQEIIHLQRILEVMNEWQKEIDEVGQPMKIEYSPAVYFFKYFSEKKLISDAQQIKTASTVLKHVPISYPGFCFDKDDVINRQENIPTIGVFIKEQDAQDLGICDFSCAKYYPSRMCITSAVQSSREHDVSIWNMQDTREYMEKKGLKIKGDIIAKFILSDYEMEDYSIYSKIWIPFD